VKVPTSLQNRLALVLGAGLTLLWLATAWATMTLLKAEMAEVFDSALEETAQRLLPLAVLDILGREEDGIDQRIATLRDHEEFFTYIVRDDQGRVLLRSHAADVVNFPPFDGMGFRQTATHRLYFDAALQGTLTIAIAEPLTHRAKAAQEMLIGLAIPLIVILPLGFLGVFWIVGRSLRPVRRFGAELSGRGTGRGARDLSPLGSGDLPDEIKPVAGAVNALMQRLDRTLTAERSFAANAAHELRTPLAAALAQTQRLIAETTDPKAAQRAGEVEMALKRLTRLSEKLMQLARAEGGRLRHDHVSDLRPILDLVLSELDRTPDKGRIDSTRPSGPVRSDMDPDAFAIVARNLIENALRHGTGRGTERATERGTGRVQVVLTNTALRVVNAAPPLPPETLGRLTQRFERGQSNVAGSGLGLSIVQAIADGAQGRLTLLAPQGRFEAVFDLPGH
jgi:two-component system OmpR family sensor kinase